MSDEEERSSEEESEEEEAPKPAAPVKKVESEAERKKREAEEARKRVEEEERRKKEDKERKKAEVRKRLEEASKAKKGKKGFMTPERKKKLRLLLRKKAADELKKEQERKAQERRKIINERCGNPKNIEGVNEDGSDLDISGLVRICKELNERIHKLEDEKYDLEYSVRSGDFQINELNIQVNDLRGKFVKPSLRKVSKYDQKFAKLQKATKAQDFDFRSNLKQSKSKFKIEEEDTQPKKEKPEWALGAKEKAATAEDEE